MKLYECLPDEIVIQAQKSGVAWWVDVKSGLVHARGRGQLKVGRSLSIALGLLGYHR